MLTLIDRTVFNGRPTLWEGTAADLQAMLEKADPLEASTLFDFNSAAGTYLGRLAKNLANRVEKRGTGSGNHWIIHPPRNRP